MSPEAFEARIEYEPNTGCWLWMGAIIPAGGGYAEISQNRKPVYVHRLMYEKHKGPIPDGLEIDHLCRVSSCVNPDHLEAVTHRENMLRGLTVGARNAAKTHCPKGHPLDGHIPKHRYCLTCNRLRSSAWRARRRAATP